MKLRVITAGVLGALALWGGSGGTRAPTSHAAEGERPEVALVGRPIATFARRAQRAPEYTVYARLNRALPRTTSGGLYGGFRLGQLGITKIAPDGLSSGLGTLGRRDGRHCYFQTLTAPVTGMPPSMARPRTGKRHRVEVRIGGVPAPLVSSTRLRRASSTPRAVQRIKRELGC